MVFRSLTGSVVSGVLGAGLWLVAAAPCRAQPAEPNSGGGGSISGYMEMQYQKPESADPTFDFRRFVLIFAHRFSDRIRFFSELEIAHAVVAGSGEGEGGEVELEQAYLDFLIDRRFNVRAGQLLVPVGIINERHEPPVFYGVQRPFVDTFIIPTTWFDIGAGVFGDFGRGWRYRAYAMAPLDATEFSADEGLSESSQHGSRANTRHWAGTGRLEYLGVRRLTLGASVWRGRSLSGVGEPGAAMPDPTVTIAEGDGRGRVGRLELRGQWAMVFVDGANKLNQVRALREGSDPNVASQMLGWYAEAAHPLLKFRSPWEVIGFVRYEQFDTQHAMPTGFQPLAQYNRTAWEMGVSYYPDPDVVVKVDYTIQHNQSAIYSGLRTWNVGLGWWF